MFLLSSYRLQPKLIRDTSVPYSYLAVHSSVFPGDWQVESSYVVFSRISEQYLVVLHLLWLMLLWQHRFPSPTKTVDVKKNIGMMWNNVNIVIHKFITVNMMYSLKNLPPLRPVRMSKFKHEIYRNTYFCKNKIMSFSVRVVKCIYKRGKWLRKNCTWRGLFKSWKAAKITTYQCDILPVVV